jgi:hypothetical protein
MAPRIRIKWIKSEKAWGYADAAKRTIELDRRLDDQTMLEIAVHETAHICLPVLDEAAVETLGKQAADVLWRLGFRRAHDGDE